MTREGGSYRWWLLLLLGGAYFFHQADRAIFGVLTPYIAGDLNLSKPEIGRINQILSWTIALVTFFAGFVGDRFSRKWVITLSLMFWSLATAAMGLAGDWRIGGVAISAYLVVVFLRSLATGGGESFYCPSAFALLATHHRETRSVAFSVHQSALYVGLMFSGALVAWAFHLLGGWRPVFMVFGGMGFVLGIVFCFALKDRPSHANGEAFAAMSSCRQPPPLGKSVKAFLCNPAALCAMCGYIAIVFTNNAYMSWAPKFFARKFEVLSVGEAGFGSMFWHHVFALVAILVGGIVTDRLVRRNPRCRPLFQGAMTLLGAPTLVWVGFSQTVVTAWMAVAAYGVFRGLAEVNTHPSLFDVIAPEYRSTSEGVMNFIAFFIGSTAPLLFGALSDRYGVQGFEIGFAVLAAVYVVGACALFASYRFCFAKFQVEERENK